MKKSIYLSYAIADENWVKRLKLHLNGRQEELGMEILEDDEILPGEEVDVYKNKIFGTVKVAVVLLSADYLAEDDLQRDAKKLTALAIAGQIKILPIFINHCTLPDKNPLSAFQPLNPSNLPMLEMSESQRAGFFGYVGNQIKKVFKEKMEEVVAGITASSEKEEIKQDLKKIKTSITKDEKIFRDELRLSLARICVIGVLRKVDEKKNPNGLKIKEILLRTKTKWRKPIFQTLEEMENWKYIIKTKVGKSTYWKLSKKGFDISEEVSRSFLFNQEE